MASRLETGHGLETRHRLETRRIKDFWRHLCSRDPDRHEVDLPPTTRAAISDREQGRGSDKGDTSGTHSTPLVTGHIPGWHGSSSETLRHLLQEVVKLNRRYNNTDELHRDIYSLYLFYQQGFPIEGEKDLENLRKVRCPENIMSQLQEAKEGELGGFFHFIRQGSSSAQVEDRVTLNIQPDYIPAVTQYLVEKIAQSDYIYGIKVAYPLKFAQLSLSNIIIYLHLGKGEKFRKNEDDLHYITRTCVKYTRPGNPAMMMSLTRGIAYAKESEDGSFGNTHVKPIVDAIIALQANGNETGNFDKLLKEVKRQFEAHGINSEKPHLYLPKGDPEGKGKAVSTKVGRVGSSSKY